jgi:hypothetical protein
MRYYSCIKDMLKNMFKTLKMLMFLGCDVYYIGDMFLHGVLRMKLNLKYVFKT